jgi:hypothetical protein
VVISDCYIENIAVNKAEPHTPLTIDADAPLPISVSVQCLQPVGWGEPQFIDRNGVFELIQTQYRAAQDVGWQSAGFPRAKQAFGLFVGKAANHASNHKQFVYNRQAQGQISYD